MNFIKNNKRFSFKLGEINAWELGFKTEIKSSGNELITVYNFENGLKITNIAKKYDVTYHTVVNVINEYVEIGLEPTLTYKRNPNSNRKKKNAN